VCRREDHGKCSAGDADRMVQTKDCDTHMETARWRYSDLNLERPLLTFFHRLHGHMLFLFKITKM